MVSVRSVLAGNFGLPNAVIIAKTEHVYTKCRRGVRLAIDIAFHHEVCRASRLQLGGRVNEDWFIGSHV